MSTATLDLTPDDLQLVRRKVRWIARSTPWLQEELISEVLLGLVINPGMTEKHPLPLAVHVIARSRHFDLLKRKRVPVVPLQVDLTAHNPGSSDGHDDLWWKELLDNLRSNVGERVARSVELVARWDLSASEVGAMYGVTKTTVRRDLLAAREYLSSTSEGDN